MEIVIDERVTENETSLPCSYRLDLSAHDPYLKTPIGQVSGGCGFEVIDFGFSPFAASGQGPRPAPTHCTQAPAKRRSIASPGSITPRSTWLRVSCGRSDGVPPATSQASRLL